MASSPHPPYPTSRYPATHLPATWLPLKRFSIRREPIEAGRTIRYYSYWIRLWIAYHAVQRIRILFDSGRSLRLLG